MRKLKDSGVEWIGQTPEDWKIVRIKQIFAEVDERCEKGNDYTLLSVSEYYGVAPRKERISEDDMLTHAETLDGYKICKKNDIVMNIMLAWKRALGVSEYIGIISPAYCVYRAKREVCAKYFHYLFRTDIYAELFKQNSTGIIDSRLRLYPDKFLALKCQVPPLNQQEAIASYLDRKCAQIDAIIAKQQQVIEKLKEYKLSVITEAVTKGLDPNVPMKDSGVEWIGMVPEHWVIGKIKNFCNLKTGSTPSTSNPEWFDGTIQWFTPGDFAENYVLKDSTRTISQKAKDDMVAVIVPSNTVMIVGIGATAGKIGYTMVECSCNQQITAISTNKILPKYLMYWMIANTKFLRDTAMFTTLPILNNQTIGNYLVIFPDDKKEEKEAVDYLDSKCDKIEMLIEAKKQEIDRLCRYKKSIIYEIATGKMEV